MKSNKELNKNIIDNFIEQELEIKPNPFLAARVMEKIAAQEHEGAASYVDKFISERKVHKLAFKFVMSLSAAAVLAFGVYLGSNYASQSNINSQNNSRLALNINDTQLENLSLYSLEE